MTTLIFLLTVLLVLLGFALFLKECVKQLFRGKIDFSDAENAAIHQLVRIIILSVSTVVFFVIACLIIVILTF